MASIKDNSAGVTIVIAEGNNHLLSVNQFLDILLSIQRQQNHSQRNPQSYTCISFIRNTMSLRHPSPSPVPRRGSERKREHRTDPECAPLVCRTAAISVSVRQMTPILGRNLQ